MAKKYLLGLDLGTDSVGWCVTDENNKIVRKGGKSLWGSRLFEEANDCSDRRMNREARRRYNRRAQRIDFLQEIFANEIAKIDPNFFVRMNNSSLLEEDKEVAAKGAGGTLFGNIGGLEDKKFYQKYPTIYHLRYALLKGKEKADIRLLYLVFHHMIKYRGNFIHYGEELNLSNGTEIRNEFNRIDESLSKMGKVSFQWDENKINKFLNIALNTYGINDSKRSFLNFFQSDDLFVKNIVCPLLAGGKLHVSKIYDLDEDDEPDPKDISVRSATFDDDFGKLMDVYSTRPETQIIRSCKAISDFILLKRLLGTSTSISEAMVGRYAQHQKDLKELKLYVKEHCQNKYNLVFRTYDPTVNNYVRYVGMNDVNGKVQRTEHCARDDFYEFLKKEIFNISKNQEVTDESVKKILNRMENGEYLPRQNSTDNGVFPYQLNLAEMKTIIANQEPYYPFLNASDKDGYVTKEKIKSILTFHIPYYVGPLISSHAKEDKKKFAWVVRGEEKITPWNFHDEGIVDFDQSAQNFIQRMLNKCTYLPNCYCLAKNSFLYSRYEVISFLNNILINGKKIPAHKDASGDVSKEELLENVFEKESVTKASLISYLKTHYGKFDASLLTYKNGAAVDSVDVSMKSYADFTNILGKEYVSCHEDQIEQIINDLSVFTDKGIIERRLRKKYGFKDETIIRKIKSLNYSGFGKLSKEFLNLKSPWVDLSTGEVKKTALLDVMNETGCSLMEVINSPRYSFKKQIKDRQEAYSPVLNPNLPKIEQVKATVNSLYVSPNLKRPLLQAYEIVDEVQKILGAPVNEYYIECTRGTNLKAKGNKKPSRLENLLKLYAEAKTNSTRLLNELNAKENLTYPDKQLKEQIVSNKTYLDSCFEQLKQHAANREEMKFRSDKVFFYYIQLGRCMYSLKPLDFGSIFADEQLYDIDHIIPQSLVKDDSLENRVLVYQDYNRKKQDKYPLPAGFLAPGAIAFYHYLHRIGLIGDKKLSSLIRPASSELSDEELASFTNRQLVSTNQAVIGLINIIQRFEKVNGKAPEVVFSKAGLVSDFRNEFDILKSRDANDFHHAHDAYLNIIVGRANHEYFRYMNGKGWFASMHNQHLTTNPNRIFDQYSKDAINKGFIKQPIKDAQGNVCWDYERSLEQIKKDIYHRYDVMVTVRQFVQPGLFSKVSIHKKADWRDGNLFPLKKGSNPEKYGGYSDLTNGFFSLVLINDKKGKESVTMIPVPNIYANKDEPNKILAYAKKVVGLNATKILVNCLRINTVVKKGKSTLLLSGKSSFSDAICKCLNEMYFAQEDIRIIRSVSKLCTVIKNGRKIGLDPNKLDFDDKLNSILGVQPNSASLIISPAANEKRNRPIVLTGQDEIHLYDVLLSKLSSPLFIKTGGPENTASLMKKDQTKNAFLNMSIGKRAVVLSEILKETAANSAERADLHLLGGPSHQMIRHLSSSNLHNCAFIAQSVTGYFDKTIYRVK